MLVRCVGVCALQIDVNMHAFVNACVAAICHGMRLDDVEPARYLDVQKYTHLVKICTHEPSRKCHHCAAICVYISHKTLIPLTP